MVNQPYKMPKDLEKGLIFFFKIKKEHDEKILNDLAKDADSFLMDDKSNIIKKDQMANLFVNEQYD